MIIELHKPFSDIWRKGYLSLNNDGRKIVSLYNSATDRKTISYARYLKSIELGYLVPDDLEVDHKDNNKTNDDIGNLQLLTKVKNIEKDNIRRHSKYNEITLNCVECNQQYTLTSEQNRNKTNNKTELNFCSRKCSGKYYNVTKGQPSNKLDVTLFSDRVIELRKKGFSDRKISEITGLTRWGVSLVK